MKFGVTRALYYSSVIHATRGPGSTHTPNLFLLYPSSPQLCHKEGLISSRSTQRYKTKHRQLIQVTETRPRHLKKIIQLFWDLNVHNMSFTVSMFPAGLVVAILLFVYSRRYHLPPGPPGNVAGEFTNTPMYEVFEKWRRKYGMWHDTGTCL